MLAALVVLGVLVGGAQPAAVGLVPSPWDKLAHGVVYALLALAVGVASGLRGPRMVAVALAGALAVGVVDEWHQMFLAGRNPGLDDLAADAAGAAVAAAGLAGREWLQARRRRHIEGR